MTNKLPKWQNEIENFKIIKNTLIIEGNTNDIYPFFEKPAEGESLKVKNFYSLNKFFYYALNSNNDNKKPTYLFYNPLLHFEYPFSVPESECQETQDLIQEVRNEVELSTREFREHNKGITQNHNNTVYVNSSEIIYHAMRMHHGNGIAVIVDLASRLINSADNLSVDDSAVMMNLLMASKDAFPDNILVLIVEKLGDIPSWFYQNNPNIRTITIPKPDRKSREAFVEKEFGFDDKQNREKEKLVALSEGLKLLELRQLSMFYESQTATEKNVSDMISVYKYGFSDDPWADIYDRLSGFDLEQEILKSVKGQEQAVKKSVEIIKRSVVGLSGIQHSSDKSKPRGILFMAGPTGTGKTELVKAITQLLFEDKRAMIRFDMSEYAEEHSDQKLFGAPPGYIGYENGGQLTNAVRSNPFSVLLFDEIEKAHDSIMDKFLQILEDGRMTDGQGNTVYFSETMIFFTSNLGIQRDIIQPDGSIIRENVVKPNDSYETICQSVDKALCKKYKQEAINRIGKDNIVVFNYITENVSNEIVESKIETINKNILSRAGITVTHSESLIKHIKQLALSEEVRQFGGRGIINLLEKTYVNTISSYIYDNKLSSGVTIIIDYSNGSIVVREDESND